MMLARASDATKRFGAVTAVERANLTVDPGEVVGLLGGNGAGKTTLIRMLLGLVGPTEGAVELFGRPPSRASRARIGYVPQSLGLYTDLTVAENLQFTARAFRAEVPHSDDLRAIESELVRDLPLGFRRRVAFAAALGHEPGLLFLDEPTSGVDPLARAHLWEMIRGAAEAGAGVLVTTHYMEEVEHCDRLVVMAVGRVVAEGSMESIIGDARAVVIDAESWERAYARLEEAGMDPALIGRSLRVLGDDESAVKAALAGESARITIQPATFEETFVRIAAGAA
jgi:ABC-2 type transport system ATP-binding protein